MASARIETIAEVRPDDGGPEISVMRAAGQTSRKRVQRSDSCRNAFKNTTVEIGKWRWNPLTESGFQSGAKDHRLHKKYRETEPVLLCLLCSVSFVIPNTCPVVKRWQNAQRGTLR